MWTHREPYHRSQLTRSSIEYHGEIGLYRSINIGRAIGFIGSGVSVAYHRPTWRFLVSKAYEYISSEWKKNFDKPQNAGSERDLHSLWRAHKTLEILHKDVETSEKTGQVDGEKLKLVIELCEHLARRMDQIDREQGNRRKITFVGSLRSELARHVGTQDALDPDTIPKNLHPLHWIYYDLQIRRYLTTNYDTTIEWFLLRERGFEKERGEPGLKDLVAMTGEDPPAVHSDNHRQFSFDALGRSALSVTLTDDSVGQLLAFSAFPQAHEAQVFHLHGRIDDPTNLIVSERDYQRTYLSQTLARLPFQEALDTLFLGNDVIFIGVGMSEGDLMRPLRQFVADDHAPDTESLRIFALLPRPLEVEAIGRSIDFRVRYGIQTLYFGDEFFAYRLQIINTLRRHLDHILREPSAITGCDLDQEIRQIYCPILDDNEIERFLERSFDESRIAEINDLLGTIRTDAEKREKPTLDQALRALFPKNLMSRILPPGERHLEDFSHLLGRVRHSPSAGLRKTVTDLENAFQIDALKEKINDLARQQRRWWNDWLKFPRERRARYAFSTTRGADGRCIEIWGRSRPSYLNVDAKEEKAEANEHSTPFKDAIEHARNLFGKEDGEPASPEPAGRRILRLTNQRGSGKGALFNELQTAANFETLFPPPANSSANSYKAAFFVHTNFSLEFSSVVGALIAFVAKCATQERDLESARKWMQQENDEGVKLHGRERGDFPRTLDDLSEYPHCLLRADGSDRGLWDDKDPPNRLHQVLKVLGRYRDQHRNAAPGDQVRLFICLSGLERICDSDGMAYNPFHRAFFRILADGRMQDAPLDVVLLSGDPNRPIRYLSEEEYAVTEQEAEQIETSAGKNRLSTRSDEIAGSRNVINRAELDPKPELEWRNQTSLVLRQKRWLPLKTLPLHERNWLEHKDSIPGGSGFVSLSALDRAPHLKQLVQNSVALDNWVSLCAKRYFEIWSGDVVPEAVGKLYSDRKEWILRLDQAAAKGGATDVIREVFRTYRLLDRPTDHDTLGVILHHLALFSLPVQPLVLLTCPDVRQSLRAGANVEKGADGRDQLLEKDLFDKLVRHLDLLAVRGLVVKVLPSQRRRGGEATLNLENERAYHVRYVLHAQMREYLARQMRFAMPDQGERNFFQVSLYPTQPKDLSTPSEEHFRLIHQVVSTLINSCRDGLRPFYDVRERYEDKREKHEDRRKNDPSNQDDKPSMEMAKGTSDTEPHLVHAIPQKLRAVYSILRLSFSVASLSRLKKFTAGTDESVEPYEIYRAWLRSLLNAAIGQSFLSDRTEDREQDAFRKVLAKSNFSLRGAFYREEIVWLYNERALTAFAQGRLYDALPIFKQALSFAKTLSGGEEDEAHRAAERRINLNLSLAQIERGNLKKARSMLEELVEITDGPMPPKWGVTHELARGFLGLCDHLSGNLESGRDRYKRMITFASEKEMFRTLSIFHRHHGDLLRIINNYDEAEHQLRLSALAAAQHEQNDILQLSMIAQARLARDIGDTSMLISARQLLDDAEKYAEELGLVKIKVETLKVRSDIIFAQGELEQAGRLAARSVALANRHGMRLRKLSSLILYGRILHRRGQTDLASAVLSETAREAARHSYQLKVKVAHDTMRHLS